MNDDEVNLQVVVAVLPLEDLAKASKSQASRWIETAKAR